MRDAGTWKAREEQTPFSVYFGGAGGKGLVVVVVGVHCGAQQRAGPGLGLKRYQGESFFIRWYGGRTQIARTMSKNENVEATGKCRLISTTFPHTWQKQFLISGKFKCPFFHRHLFFGD